MSEKFPKSQEPKVPKLREISKAIVEDLQEEGKRELEKKAELEEELENLNSDDERKKILADEYGNFYQAP